jgi:hypothetical protein
MMIYLGRDRKHVTAMIATCAILTELTADIETVGHKFCLDSFFSSSELFDILFTKTGSAIAQMVSHYFHCDGLGLISYQVMWDMWYT